MPYNVTKLITRAYYLSGIVSREFETVSGTQLTDGLDCLNDLFADKTIDTGLIPYYKRLNFNAIDGVGEYFIENLIDIETFTFFINSVRYSTIKNGRKNFFGSPRAENIESLPFNWHLEREFGGARLFLYFKPDTAYPLEIWGLFRLEEVDFNDDLSLTYDRFYIDYIKHQLVPRLCDEFSYIVPPGVSERLAVLTKGIDKKSGEMDLSQQIVSTLDQSYNGGLNYGQVNIGRGWTT